MTSRSARQHSHPGRPTSSTWSCKYKKLLVVKIRNISLIHHTSGHLCSFWIGSPNLPCSSKSLNSERSTGTTLGMADLSWKMATKPLLLFLLVDQLCFAQRAPRYLSVFTIVRFNADACLGFYTNRCTFLSIFLGLNSVRAFITKSALFLSNTLVTQVGRV